MDTWEYLARAFGRDYADQIRDLSDHAESLSPLATLGWDAVHAFEREHEVDGSAADLAGTVKRAAEERWAEIVEEERLAAGQAEIDEALGRSDYDLVADYMDEDGRRCVVVEIAYRGRLYLRQDLGGRWSRPLTEGDWGNLLACDSGGGER